MALRLPLQRGFRFRTGGREDGGEEESGLYRAGFSDGGRRLLQTGVDGREKQDPIRRLVDTAALGKSVDFSDGFEYTEKRKCVRKGYSGKSGKRTIRNCWSNSVGNFFWQASITMRIQRSIPVRPRSIQKSEKTIKIKNDFFKIKEDPCAFEPVGSGRSI